MNTLASLANAAPAGPRPKQCGADYAIATLRAADPEQADLLEKAIDNPYAPARAIAETIDELTGYRIQTQTVNRHRDRRCACDAKETK